MFDSIFIFGCKKSTVNKMNPDIIDSKYSPYTMPSVIIGTIINKKPNFMLCTWVSRVNRTPPLWMAAINNKHYTLEGIKSSQNFSLNFASAELVKETDYVGITKGRKVDKSDIFDVFYGKTGAPLVIKCPYCIELSVTHSIQMGDHTLIIGNAENSYLDGKYYTDGTPDMSKMDLMVYTGKPAEYWALGKKAGDAFSIGQDLKK